MDTLRKIEATVAVSGLGLLAFGLLSNINEITLPGAVAVGAVAFLEIARVILRNSNIDPPQPPGLH